MSLPAQLRRLYGLYSRRKMQKKSGSRHTGRDPLFYGCLIIDAFLTRDTGAGHAALKFPDSESVF